MKSVTGLLNSINVGDSEPDVIEVIRDDVSVYEGEPGDYYVEGDITFAGMSEFVEYDTPGGLESRLSIIGFNTVNGKLQLVEWLVHTSALSEVLGERNNNLKYVTTSLSKLSEKLS